MANKTKKNKEFKELVEKGYLAKQRQYERLTNKLKRGQLSPQEMKVFNSLEKELTDEQAKRQPLKKGRWIVDTKTAADFFGVSVRMIQKYHKDMGCPIVRRGWWDLKALFLWWLDNVYEQTVVRDDETVRKYAREGAKWKAELARIKVQKEKGELFPRSEIAEQWALRVAEIRTGLLAYKMRLSALLEMKPKQEIEEIIDDENWHLFDNFTREGRFTPVIEAEYNDASENDNEEK